MRRGPSRFIPEIGGAEHVITSNEALHLEELPKSIAIVGGGYIALEFATIFAGLGVNVSLLYRGPQILRGFDNEVREVLAEEMIKRGRRYSLQHRSHFRYPRQDWR